MSKDITQLKADLFDIMIDEKCEYDGVIETIQYLLQSGCSKQDLLELKFKEEAINYAKDLLDN